MCKKEVSMMDKICEMSDNMDLKVMNTIGKTKIASKLIVNNFPFMQQVLKESYNKKKQLRVIDNLLLIDDDNCNISYRDKINDCSWDYQIDFLLTLKLGFCGCGNPYEVGKYVIKQLNKIKKGEFNINKSLQDMFFVYIMNDKEFLEHGSTIFSSCLTKEGEKLLADLEYLYEFEIPILEFDIENGINN